MFGALANAKKSAYLEMYIFQNDTKDFDFLSLLEKKAREGLRVIVVLDSFGSTGLKSHEAERLRQAGAEVLFFSFWFQRLHRKILIIDEETAFLGGVNIAGQFAPWKDLQIGVSGKKIVGSILLSFARVYRECGGKDPALFEKGKKPKPLAKARMWFVEHGIAGKHAELKEHYERNISEAKSSIVFMTPYLIPRRWLVAHIHEAILRGVKVEIIVPEHTDHPWLMDRINYYYLALFINLGAACYLYKGMNHAKVMLVDDRVATVGSQNLDALSFEWNAEAGITFDGPKMVTDLGKILNEWKKDTELFTLDRYKKKWYDIFLTMLFKLF